jgi:hypothetical protein
MLMIVELADVCFSRVNSRWAALPDSACRCTLPALSTPMAHAATAEHAEQGSVETMDSAIGDAVADVAAAAAAAALVALPPTDAGQLTINMEA